jgi:hypothetical protein
MLAKHNLNLKNSLEKGNEDIYELPLPIGYITEDCVQELNRFFVKIYDDIFHNTNLDNILYFYLNVIFD